ncbi:hypothetical protein [uncultured virus]|uniref:Uncharacterized protein n=1 Tax=uncultured virus TaxID=340016 RepID=A0A218MN46_9VIRU|nr:hypothetical protein [uncultured virus]
MLGLGNKLSRNNKATLHGGFTPANLSDLELWLKHASGLSNTDSPATGQFPSDGGSNQISKWDDVSGNNRSAISPGSNYPTWDATENALDFSGSSDVLSLSENEIDISGEFSIFFRLKFQNATINNTDVVTSDTGGTHFIRFQSNKAIRLKIASGPLNFSWPSTMVGTSSFHTVGVKRDDSNNLSAYIDGVAASENGSVSAPNIFRVNTIEGGSDMFLKSMIITSNELSSDDQANLETYLSAQN